MVEKSDISSFSVCCYWLLSDQTVPPQPAFIPVCLTAACEQHPFLQVKCRSSVLRTLKMSCLLLIQGDGMVKVNIPKLHPTCSWAVGVCSTVPSPLAPTQHQSQPWPVTAWVEGVTRDDITCIKLPCCWSLAGQENPWLSGFKELENCWSSRKSLLQQFQMSLMPPLSAHM